MVVPVVAVFADTGLGTRGFYCQAGRPDRVAGDSRPRIGKHRAMRRCSREAEIAVESEQVRPCFGEGGLDAPHNWGAGVFGVLCAMHGARVRIHAGRAATEHNGPMRRNCWGGSGRSQRVTKPYPAFAQEAR